MKDKPTYSIAELADILEFHHETIRRMIKRGQINGIQLGTVWRIPRAEVHRLIGVTSSAELQG